MEHTYETIKKADHDIFSEPRRPEIELSPDQAVVYSSVEKWLGDRNRRNVLTFGGFAGTGKSTLLSKLVIDRGDLCFACMAFTGKAANVLRQKLGNAADVTTLHSFAYRTAKTGGAEPQFTLKRRDELGITPDFIVIDEGSMVPDENIEDIASFGFPLLVVGDHFQLPPVNGTSTIMRTPDLALEKIHRQAEGSAIIRLSVAIRERGSMPMPPPKDIRLLPWPKFVAEVSQIAVTTDFMDTAVLTYRNVTRGEVNKAIRLMKYGANAPTIMQGDVVVCLKNGERMFNGMRGVVEHVEYKENSDLDLVTVLFAEDGIRYRGPVLRAQFGRDRRFSTAAEAREAGAKRVSNVESMGMLFDYGYALTVHKAQGSSFKRAYVVREKPRKVDDDTYVRWLYTAITRASEELAIVTR